jgi:hypothetical protein
MDDEGVVTVVQLRTKQEDDHMGRELPPPFWNYTRIGEVDGTDGLVVEERGAGGTGLGHDCLDHTHLNTPR